jgi:hypothetical protein
MSFGTASDGNETTAFGVQRSGDAAGSSNVIGELPEVEVSVWTLIRRKLGEWLSPRNARDVDLQEESCCKRWFWLKPRQGIAEWVEGNDDPVRSAVIIGVVNGDITTTGGKIEARESSDSNVVTVTAKKGRRGNLRRKRGNVRINVLAGRIVFETKLRLGLIQDTPANRTLVRADCARRCEGLRRDGDPEFVNLRSKDLYSVVLWASKMYWVATDEELDVHDAMNDVTIQARVGMRTKFADPPPAG